MPTVELVMEVHRSLAEFLPDLAVQLLQSLNLLMGLSGVIPSPQVANKQLKLLRDFTYVFCRTLGIEHIHCSLTVGSWKAE